MSVLKIALWLKNKRPDVAKNVSAKTFPDGVIRVAALFSPKAKASAPMLGGNRNASNEKAKKMLGWQPRSNEEAILAAAESLVKFGSIQ